MDRVGSRIQGVLLVGAVFAIVLLGWRYGVAINLLTVERERNQDVTASLDNAQGERDEMIDIVNRLPSAAPFFEGIEVEDSSHVRKELPVDGVFYLIRVTCPFCGANDSALREIAAANVPVFVVGLDSDMATLKEWINDHGLPARAFVDVSGSFLDRLPTNRVPRTVVARSGSVTVLITGKLDSTATRIIVDSAGRP